MAASERRAIDKVPADSTRWCNAIASIRDTCAQRVRGVRLPTPTQAKIEALPATAAPELDTGRGIAPAELATRCRTHAGGLTAAKLVEWLLDENYATLVDGRLVPPQQLRLLFYARTLVQVVDG